MLTDRTSRLEVTFREVASATVNAPPVLDAKLPPCAGQREAALKHCKKRAQKHNWPHSKLRKRKKKAKLLPV
jgi:hypothetical protein